MTLSEPVTETGATKMIKAKQKKQIKPVKY